MRTVLEADSELIGHPIATDINPDRLIDWDGIVEKWGLPPRFTRSWFLELCRRGEGVAGCRLSPHTPILYRENDVKDWFRKRAGPIFARTGESPGLAT